MRASEVSGYRCPRARTTLELREPVTVDGEIRSGSLVSTTGETYPIVDGIPNFLVPDATSEIETTTQSEYDRVAESIYDAAVDWQFAAILEDEDVVRESMIDMLHLDPGARVLEVGCGTGRDSFRLARRLGEDGLLHMQDISGMMVRVCRQRMQENERTTPFACALEYSTSSAMMLPFETGFFDAVFHFGGFNQFGDLRGGAAELSRVAKLGGRVLIGDEGVAPWLKGTEFDDIVTTNNASFRADTPLDVIPEGARNVDVRWIMANCFYLIAFTKGSGPPPLNLDLPHAGWRGGSMRTRYFGKLEGVTPEAVALAKKAAAAAGVSVHSWLDKLVKDEASRVEAASPPRKSP